MQTKILELNNFMIDINKNPFMNSNHSWTIENRRAIDKMFQDLSNDYTDIKVADFNNTLSVLSLFQKGKFGPFTLNNTRLYNISKEYNIMMGDRLRELYYIYNHSMKMQEQEFIENMTLANLDIVKITNASEELYKAVPLLLKKMHPFAVAGLLIIFIALILMAVCFIFSNIAFSCVVKTQDRKYKILSNVSWCSSSLSLIMIFTAGLGFSFSGPVLSDFCRIQDLQ